MGRNELQHYTSICDAFHHLHPTNIRDVDDLRHGQGVLIGLVSALMGTVPDGYQGALQCLWGKVRKAEVHRGCVPPSWAGDMELIGFNLVEGSAHGR